MSNYVSGGNVTATLVNASSRRRISHDDVINGVLFAMFATGFVGTLAIFYITLLTGTLQIALLMGISIGLSIGSFRIRVGR